MTTEQPPTSDAVNALRWLLVKGGLNVTAEQVPGLTDGPAPAADEHAREYALLDWGIRRALPLMLARADIHDPAVEALTALAPIHGHAALRTARPAIKAAKTVADRRFREAVYLTNPDFARLPRLRAKGTQGVPAPIRHALHVCTALDWRTAIIVAAPEVVPPPVAAWFYGRTGAIAASASILHHDGQPVATELLTLANNLH